MIFHETHEKVMDGSKTQTRRPVKPNDVEIYNRDGGLDAIKRNGRTIWKVGGTYAVQPGRTAKGIGRILITKIRVERLYKISNADARAEGFSGRDEFARVWKKLYPKKGSFFDHVAVLEFELVK